MTLTPASLLRRRAGAVGLFVLAAVLWVACGGSGSGASVRDGDVTCQPIKDFSRYRYTAVVTLAVDRLDDPSALNAFSLTVDIDGAILGKDRRSVVIKYPETPNPPLPIVWIGDHYWDNIGVWTSHDVVAGVAPIPFLPADLCTSLAPDIDTAGATPVPEKVNGMDTLKYTFPSLPSGFSTRLWGMSSDMGQFIKVYDVEVWLHEKDGWPVRFDLKGSGNYENGQGLRAAVRMELRDINDKSIKIEPPIPE